MASTTTTIITPATAHDALGAHAGHGTHGAHATHVVHHEPGSMDVREHERMFNGFVRFMTWSAVAVLALLVFLALTNA